MGRQAGVLVVVAAVLALAVSGSTATVPASTSFADLTAAAFGTLI